MAKKSTQSKKVTTKKVPSTSAAPSIIDRIRTYSFGTSRAYLFEYGLLLLVVGGLLGLLSIIVRDISNALADDRFSDRFVAASSFSDAVLVLSALLVLLPATVVLIQRTAAAERLTPGIKNIGWRKGFLGIFLATIGISALVSSVFFVNGILSYLTGAQDEFAWGAVIGIGVTALILAYVARAFAGDYRSLVDPKAARHMHYARYALVFGSLILASLYIIFPMTEYRDASERSLKSEIRNIQCSEDGFDSEYKYKDDTVKPLPFEQY